MWPIISLRTLYVHLEWMAHFSNTTTVGRSVLFMIQYRILNSAFFQDPCRVCTAFKIPGGQYYPMYGKDLTKSFDFSKEKFHFVNFLFILSPDKKWNASCVTCNIGYNKNDSLVVKCIQTKRTRQEIFCFFMLSDCSDSYNWKQCLQGPWSYT